MNLGESLIDTAKREVFEETGLKINNLLLLDVLSGPEYFYKNQNEDELYSVTAVYTTTDFIGDLVPDMDESINLKFYNVDFLPEHMETEYMDCIKVYLRTINL